MVAKKLKKKRYCNVLIGDKDKDDVPFLAVALAVDGIIWSDNKDDFDQTEIDVWGTSKVINKFK